jgi:hypothetical protein
MPPGMGGMGGPPPPQMSGGMGQGMPPMMQAALQRRLGM